MVVQVGECFEACSGQETEQNFSCVKYCQQALIADTLPSQSTFNQLLTLKLHYFLQSLGDQFKNQTCF